MCGLKRTVPHDSQSIEALKTNIQRIIGEIELQLCKNLIKIFDKNIDVCKCGCGGHMSDIIFHS